MKNKYFDQKRTAAKKYAKKWHRYGEMTPLGNVLYHQYPEEHKKTEGWWDDVAFRMGSQIVVVWWVHPRMVYSDTASNAAYELLEAAPKWDLSADGVKNYKRIGKNKNRKRVISTTMAPIPKDFRDWADDWDAKTKLIQETGDIVIKPSIKIEQYDWCRGVSLCMPVEAIDAKSVEYMAELAKQILRGETTLEKLFPGYTYTKEDWIKEGNSKCVI